MTSLSNLAAFGPTHLTLHQAAVNAICGNGDHGVLAHMLIDIGHDLHVLVVGTGVETEQQAAFLHEHGCDELQGTYISRPLAPCALHQLVAAGSPRH